MAGEVLQPKSDFLLDTGIIIRYLRGKRQAADLLDFLDQLGEVHVSVITYLEILINVQPREEESTRLFFERVSPLVVNQEVAQKAASLIKKHPAAFGKEVGRGTPDALIAATAWQGQAVFVTLNTRHFAKVPIAEITIQAIEQDAEDWTSLLKT
ncbi:PIN domain-containing protein [Chloroflexota bacterium]